MIIVKNYLSYLNEDLKSILRPGGKCRIAYFKKDDNIYIALDSYKPEKEFTSLTSFLIINNLKIEDFLKGSTISAEYSISTSYSAINLFKSMHKYDVKNEKSRGFLDVKSSITGAEFTLSSIKGLGLVPDGSEIKWKISMNLKSLLNIFIPVDAKITLRK